MSSRTKAGLIIVWCQLLDQVCHLCVVDGNELYWLSGWKSSFCWWEKVQTWQKKRVPCLMLFLSSQQIATREWIFVDVFKHVPSPGSSVQVLKNSLTFQRCTFTSCSNVSSCSDFGRWLMPDAIWLEHGMLRWVNGLHRNWPLTIGTQAFDWTGRWPGKSQVFAMISEDSNINVS